MDDQSPEHSSNTPPEGMSALDLLSLTPHQRKIMRLLLRRSEASYAELRQIIEEADKEEDRAQLLDTALDELIQQGWLIRRTDIPERVYKVNLRKKSGSFGTHRARSSLSQDFWTSLDAKSSPNPPRDSSDPSSSSQES